MKDYKNSRMYIHFISGEKKPMFPLNRVINDGVTHTCPNCGSSARREFLNILGNRYCLNDDCIYHYFEITKETKVIKNANEFFAFIREQKLKRVLK
jgi:hypothetical protein